MNKREYINDKYYIEKVGVGKPLYIIGGGPGLDYSYMYKWLVNLSKTRELVFYNQYGLNENEDTSLDILINQLHLILTKDSDEKDVLVHSFGSHLLFCVLSKYDYVNIGKIIAINPSETNSKYIVSNDENLLSRIPENINRKVKCLEEKEEKESRSMIMSILLPYYVYDEKIKIDFSIYNNQMCDKIQSEVGTFDFSDVVRSLKKDILLIKGEYDFISITSTLELQIVAKKTVIYNKCGHFAFAEKKLECIKEIEKFLN